jgi:hypothetical protein
MLVDQIHSYLTGIFPAVSKLILEALWVPSDTQKTLEICQARVSGFAISAEQRRPR